MRLDLVTALLVTVAYRCLLAPALRAQLCMDSAQFFLSW